jgi:hypothetical protein
MLSTISLIAVVFFFVRLLSAGVALRRRVKVAYPRGIYVYTPYSDRSS